MKAPEISVTTTDALVAATKDQAAQRIVDGWHRRCWGRLRQDLIDASPEPPASVAGH